MAISLFIYVGEYNSDLSEALQDIIKLSWSFALGWVAVVIYIISAIVYGVRAFIILRNTDGKD